MPNIILDSVTTANQRIVRQQVTKKEILKMIFGPADNIVQWQQVGKDDDYDDIARAGMTMMIIIIGDNSRPAQRGRRSEMWLDCRKVCDAQTSSAAQPSLAPHPSAQPSLASSPTSYHLSPVISDPATAGSTQLSSMQMESDQSK